jgi:hypothetical protein
MKFMLISNFLHGHASYFAIEYFSVATRLILISYTDMLVSSAFVRLSVCVWCGCLLMINALIMSNSPDFPE